MKTTETNQPAPEVLKSIRNAALPTGKTKEAPVKKTKLSKYETIKRNSKEKRFQKIDVVPGIFSEKFSALIKESRIKSGLSQKQVSIILGISRSYVTDFENNSFYRDNAYRLFAHLALLNINPQDVLKMLQETVNAVAGEECLLACYLNGDNKEALHEEKLLQASKPKGRSRNGRHVLHEKSAKGENMVQRVHAENKDKLLAPRPPARSNPTPPKPVGLKKKS